MLVHLTRELIAAGHQVTVVSLWPPLGTKIERELLEAGAALKFLNKKPGIDLGIFVKVAKVLSESEADVIHTHRMSLRYLIPWSVFHSDRRVVHTMHTLASQEGHWVDRFPLRAAYRRKLVFPVACGQAVADSFRTVYGFRPAVVRNGIEIPEISRDHPTPRLGPLELVTIARFHPAKNHEMLLKSLQELASRGVEFNMKFVGDGELRSQMAEKTVEYGLESQVRFLGQVDDVSPILAGADAMVLASHFEGTPLSVMEAMAHGVPVVVPNVGGLPDLVEDGGGWLYQSNSSVALADLLMLISSLPSLAQVGDLGRGRSLREFDRSMMAEEYLEIYLNMTEQ